MGHRHDRPAELPERLLDDVDRIEVEVVGGLVQEQELRAARHEDRDQQARPLPGAERADRAVHLLLVEQEVAQEGARVLLVRDHLGAVEVEDAALERQVVVRLRQDGRLGVDGHAAAPGRERAGEQPHEGRLARPILADNGDPLAALDREVDARQDGTPAEIDRDAVEGGNAPPAGRDAVEREREARRLGRVGDPLRLLHLPLEAALAHLRLPGHPLGDLQEVRGAGAADHRPLDRGRL